MIAGLFFLFLYIIIPSCVTIFEFDRADLSQTFDILCFYLNFCDNLEMISPPDRNTVLYFGIQQLDELDSFVAKSIFSSIVEVRYRVQLKEVV